MTETSIFTGIAIAVGAGVLLYVIKWFTGFATRAIALLVVEMIGERLQAPRAAAISTALEPVVDQVEENKLTFERALQNLVDDVAEIKNEVTINSGHSLKDAVVGVQKTLEAILTDGIGR